MDSGWSADGWDDDKDFRGSAGGAGGGSFQRTAQSHYQQGNGGLEQQPRENVGYQQPQQQPFQNQVSSGYHQQVPHGMNAEWNQPAQQPPQQWMPQQQNEQQKYAPQVQQQFNPEQQQQQQQQQQQNTNIMGGGFDGGFMAAASATAAAASAGNPADFFNNVAGNPMLQQAGLQYGANIAASGKEYVSSQVNKYVPISELQKYFQVTSHSVMRKLRLILFPFFNKEWQRQLVQNEQGSFVGLSPRDDVNAPDLYIPIMAFVTYVLLYGLALGLVEQFTPQRLGITASSAAAWYFFEFLVLFLGSYILNLTSLVTYLDIMSLIGYKYVCTNISLLCFIILGTGAFWPTYLYTTSALAFFLYRTLSLQMIQGAEQNTVGSKRNTYFLISVSLSQFIFIYILTSSLNKNAYLI